MGIKGYCPSKSQSAEYIKKYFHCMGTERMHIDIQFPLVKPFGSVRRESLFDLSWRDDDFEDGQPLGGLHLIAML